MFLPKYTNKDEMERIGVYKTALILSEMGLIFRETSNSDTGVDGLIEEVDNECHATGRIMAVQIKSGSSYLHDGGEVWRFYIDDEHKIALRNRREIMRQNHRQTADAARGEIVGKLEEIHAHADKNRAGAHQQPFLDEPFPFRRHHSGLLFSFICRMQAVSSGMTASLYHAQRHRTRKLGRKLHDSLQFSLYHHHVSRAHCQQMHPAPAFTAGIGCCQ